MCARWCPRTRRVQGPSTASLRSATASSPSTITPPLLKMASSIPIDPVLLAHDARMWANDPANAAAAAMLQQWPPPPTPPTSPVPPASSPPPTPRRCHPPGLQKVKTIKWRQHEYAYICDVCGHSHHDRCLFNTHMRTGALRQGFQVISVDPANDLHWYGTDEDKNEYMGDMVANSKTKRADGGKNVPVPSRRHVDQESKQQRNSPSSYASREKRRLRQRPSRRRETAKTRMKTNRPETRK